MNTQMHNAPSNRKKAIDNNPYSWEEEFDRLMEDEEYRDAVDEAHTQQVREIANEELNNMSFESDGFSDWNMDR